MVDVPVVAVPVVDVTDVVVVSEFVGEVDLGVDAVTATGVLVDGGAPALWELVQAEPRATSAQLAAIARRVRTQPEASAALLRSRVECSLTGVGVPRAARGGRDDVRRRY